MYKVCPQQTIFARNPTDTWTNECLTTLSLIVFSHTKKLCSRLSSRSALLTKKRPFYVFEHCPVGFRSNVRCWS